MARAKLTRLERMYQHIVESYIDRGYSLKTAKARAAATVNKHRSQLAQGKRVCKVRRGRKRCRTMRGPRLVTKGGSRRQWYPGKRRASGKRELFICLEHSMTFATKRMLIRHYRSGRHVKSRQRVQ